METITSRDNAKIKYACAVRDSEKQRAADGLFFAEGPKLCLELAKSCTPRTVYATAAALAKTPELATLAPAEIAPHVAEKLSGTKSNQGVFALFETPTPPADTLDTVHRPCRPRRCAPRGGRPGGCRHCTAPTCPPHWRSCAAAASRHWRQRSTGRARWTRPGTTSHTASAWSSAARGRA